MMSAEILLNELTVLVAEFKSLAEAAKKLDRPDIAQHLDGARVLLVRAIEEMDFNPRSW